MDDPIAWKELIRVRLEGEQTTFRIEIGTPYLAPDRKWRCPVELPGLAGTLEEVVGENPLHALCSALALVRSQLRTLSDDGDRVLEPASHKEFPFDSYFPE
jgi:hypothetical protein